MFNEQSLKDTVSSIDNALSLSNSALNQDDCEQLHTNYNTRNNYKPISTTVKIPSLVSILINQNNHLLQLLWKMRQENDTMKQLVNVSEKRILVLQSELKSKQREVISHNLFLSKLNRYHIQPIQFSRSSDPLYVSPDLDNISCPDLVLSTQEKTTSISNPQTSANINVINTSVQDSDVNDIMISPTPADPCQDRIRSMSILDSTYMQLSSHFTVQNSINLAKYRRLKYRPTSIKFGKQFQLQTKLVTIEE